MSLHHVFVLLNQTKHETIILIILLGFGKAVHCLRAFSNKNYLNNFVEKISNVHLWSNCIKAPIKGL